MVLAGAGRTGARQKAEEYQNFSHWCARSDIEYYVRFNCLQKGAGILVPLK
jgi:hypothetical protein